MSMATMDAVSGASFIEIVSDKMRTLLNSPYKRALSLRERRVVSGLSDHVRRDIGMVEERFRFTRLDADTLRLRSA